MRVLLISLSYQGGGAERCARELLNDLPKVGIQPEMWVARRQATDPASVRAMQHPWEPVFNCLDAIPQWTDWRHRGSIHMLDRLRPGDFDLVHLHVIHDGCASIRAVRRLTERIPTVWTFHDEWAITGGNCFFLGNCISPQEVKRWTLGWRRHIPYHSYHENFRFRGLRRFLASAMPEPCTIICPSGYLLDATRQSRRFPISRLVRIPYGVNMLELHPSSTERVAARRAFGLRDDIPVVLLIAANLTDPRKGMLMAVEAINKLPGDHRVQVLLLGRETRRLASLFERAQVKEAYAANDASLISAYRSADVTLIPSLADNLPYVGLESLACGTPIVAFQVGGLPDIIGEDQRGLLVDRFNLRMMTDKLTKLLGNPQLCQKLGLAGHRWTLEECHPRVYLSRIVDVYRQAISQQGTGRNLPPSGEQR